MLKKLINTKIGIYILSSLLWLLFSGLLIGWFWKMTRPISFIQQDDLPELEINESDIQKALEYLSQDRLTAPFPTDTLKLSLPESTPSGVTEGR